MLQHQLIEDCKNNSRKAQLKLYNKYCDGMYYVALRFMNDTQEAEDAMEILMQALQQVLHLLSTVQLN